MVWAESAAENGVPAVMRARSLEIIDGQNRVRALLAVMPPSTVDGRNYPETVLLRMIDPQSGPVVKLSAAKDGSGLMLSDESDKGILMRPGDNGPFVRVTDKDGREKVVRP